MLRNLLGTIWRRVIGKVLGLDTIVGEELPRVVRKEIDAALRELVTRGFAPPRPAIDVEYMAYFLASVSAARYFLERMPLARNLVNQHDLIRFAMEQSEVEGLILEFGVYRGKTLRVIAAHTAQTVYGFDSFEGLPEDWTHFQRKGRFSLDGGLPVFEQTNVKLVKGWFENTLPVFLAEHTGAARFVHVDSDLYRSAATVLTHLRSRIVSGTVILFDEYFNYPGWEHHEYRAFQEFIRDTGLGYEYLGFASSQQGVAVKIK